MSALRGSPFMDVRENDVHTEETLSRENVVRRLILAAALIAVFLTALIALQP